MDQDAPQREWGEDGLPIGETEGERVVREAREAAMIARGIAELKAGLYLTEDELDAWFDQLDRDPDAPMPVPVRRQPLL